MKKFLLVIGLALSLNMNMYGANVELVSCGKGSDPRNACNLTTSVQKVVNATLKVVMELILTAVFFILILTVFRMLKARWEGKAQIVSELKSSMTKLGMVFFVLALIFWFAKILSMLGVSTEFIPTWIRFTISSFIEPAYALGDLPSPIGETTVYDYFLLLMRLFMNWVIYPFLLLTWMWTGVKYVFAQGSPEKLKDAHSWLMWVTAITIFFMAVEAIAFALRTTVVQVLG